LARHRLLEERFQKGLTTLLEISAEGIPIVVEGLKDVATLRYLGLSGPILTLAGHSIVTLADKLTEFSRILILFDFDSRGKQLARQLTEQLRGKGIFIMQDMRRNLQHAFSWRSRVIEGLRRIDNSEKATKL
jgi:5S rRNA maturation endonuclease (ribonuclease M5)